MINHVRTLLLNPAMPGVSSHYVGDEFVPAGYGQLAIPSKFDRVRKIVFGPAADRYMMNYRLAEIMALLHTTELEEFVLAFDPRVTYWPPTERGIFDAAFGVTVVPDADYGTRAAHIHADPAPETPSIDDPKISASVNGQLYDEWYVYTSSVASMVPYYATYEIRKNSKPSSTVTITSAVGIANVDGLPLHGSNLLLTLNDPTAGDGYLIKSLKRPKHDLAAVAEQLRTGMGAETQAALFYRTSEPFKTFSNLWFDHDQLAYKFGGLILALAHHLDELRTGVAV